MDSDAVDDCILNPGMIRSKPCNESADRWTRGFITTEAVLNDSLNLMDETRNGVTLVHVITPWLIDPKLSEMLTSRLCGLLESGADPLVIDLGGVTRLTSIFFRSFIMAGQEAKKRKACMAFCNVSPVIRQGFEIVGLDKLFPMFESEQKALRELGSE